MKNPGVPVMAQWLTNPTRNHEVSDLIPGLAHWVKDLLLLICDVGHRLGLDPAWLWLWYSYSSYSILGLGSASAKKKPKDFSVTPAENTSMAWTPRVVRLVTAT